MQRKRVLFISPTHAVLSGMAQWMESLCQTLGDAGWEPIVGLVAGPVYHKPGPFRDAFPGLTCVDIPSDCATRWSRVSSVMHAVRRIKPAIVVPLELLDPLESVARLKLAGQNVRLVIARHNAGSLGAADVRAYASYVDMIVGVSRLITKLIELHSTIEPERIRYVPPGILPPRQRGLRAWDHRPIRLGYVGRLDEQKRVFDLVDLCRELKRLDVAFRLEIFGAGPCQAELRQRLHTEVAEHQVCFRGQVPAAALYDQAYPHLDCILLLSAVEGNPICLLEGMLHGVVPVTSRFRGCRAERLVRDGISGLTFAIGDMAAAAQRIQQLDCDRSAFERLSLAATEAVGEQYLATNVNSQWLKIFEQSLQLPCKVGDALPKLPESAVPYGRLNRMGLPDWAARAVRRLSGRQPMPATPSEEWPYACNLHDADVLREIDELAACIELERPVSARDN